MIQIGFDSFDHFLKFLSTLTNLFWIKLFLESFQNNDFKFLLISLSSLKSDCLKYKDIKNYDFFNFSQSLKVKFNQMIKFIMVDIRNFILFHFKLIFS